MDDDQPISALFDESVARDDEAWYEQGFGHQAVQQEEELLSQHLHLFPGARSLLEVGCGTGHFTRWFARQGLEVMGLDGSPAMLAQARARNGLRYVQGDARALPFENQQFDLVAFITVLEFVSDPVAVLREGMRVSRQGLLLGVLNRWSLLAYTHRLRGQQPDSVLARAHRFGSADLTRAIRQAAGAREIRLTWRTTIFPAWWPLRFGRLPWGEYLGMAVRLGPVTPQGDER